MSHISLPPSSRRRKGLALLCATVLPALLAACGGGGGGSDDSGGGSGKLTVALTDAPSCGYQSVYVTVRSVAVHQNANAGSGDPGWQVLTLNPARRLDLLTLTNGVFATLGQLALPPGNYQQVRLNLADNSATTPLANAITPVGGTATALDTPSAQQTGLKLNADIHVPDGGNADLLLDFNACESVVQRGKSGQYLLKPVLKVIPDVDLDGIGEKVEGYVAPALASAGVRVSLQQNGSVVRATTPESSGRFVLAPVPTGTYDLVINGNGFSTMVIQGVPVSESTNTVLNTAAAALLSPVFNTGVVSGRVAFASGSGIPEADTTALQKLGDGSVIELESRPTNAADGSFRHVLPISAPLRGPYNSSGSYTLNPDTSVAAQYVIRAHVTNLGYQEANADLSDLHEELEFLVP